MTAAVVAADSAAVQQSSSAQVDENEGVLVHQQTFSKDLKWQEGLDLKRQEGLAQGGAAHTESSFDHSSDSVETWEASLRAVGT